MPSLARMKEGSPGMGALINDAQTNETNPTGRRRIELTCRGLIRHTSFNFAKNLAGRMAIR